VDDIDALIEDAAEQLEVVAALYGQAVAERKLPPLLPARIKNVVEHQRSSLDYLAQRILDTYGSRKAKAYYPFAWNDNAFQPFFDRNLPGVAAARSDIRDAIKNRQPYQPGYQWMDDLNRLSTQNKHRELTPQSQEIRIDLSDLIILPDGSVEPTGPATITTSWLFGNPQKPPLETLRAIQDATSPSHYAKSGASRAYDRKTARA